MRRQYKLKSKRSLLAAPYLFWSVAFIIIPLIMVFYYGFIDESGAFTLENIAAIASPEHSKALWISMRLSLISTIICFLLAYPLAMILANMSVNQNQFIVLISESRMEIQSALLCSGEAIAAMFSRVKAPLSSIKP